MKNKAVRITLTVLTYVFVALCIFFVIFSVVSKRTNGAVTMFGYQARIVISESMAKCDKTDVSGYDIKDIPLKSMVFIEVVPENQDDAKAWYGSLEVGDVLTFNYKYDRQETITHRIADISPNKKASGEFTGGYTITLRGDNVALADNPNAGQADIDAQVINTDLAGVNYVIGKVTGQSVFLGNVIYALTQPIGIALVIILPSAIIMVLEIVKIVNIVMDEKKNKAQQKRDEQQDEIEQLKRQLEELQQKAASQETQKE